MIAWKWFAVIVALGGLIAAAAGFLHWIDGRGYSRAQAECASADLQAKLDASHLRIAELETSLSMSRTAAAEAAARELALKKEAQDARKNLDSLNAGLRDGSIRLRDKFTCPKPAAPTSAGHISEARSGFDEADARAAFAIAGDGDQAIRELNACIDQMNADRAILERLP